MCSQSDVTNPTVEDWEISHLDEKCPPSQFGYVYGRPVCFQVWSVCVYSLSGGGVLVVKHERMASFSRLDITGQNGKCDLQAEHTPK